MKIKIKLNISKAFNAINKAKSSTTALFFSAAWLVTYVAFGDGLSFIALIVFLATGMICRTIENK
jgi:hypothetical protein